MNRNNQRVKIEKAPNQRGNFRPAAAGPQSETKRRNNQKKKLRPAAAAGDTECKLKT